MSDGFNPTGKIGNLSPVIGIPSSPAEITPTVGGAVSLSPSIASIRDQYGRVLIFGGQPLGPGFFLYITYPESIMV